MEPLFQIRNCFDKARTVAAQRIVFRRSGQPYMLLGAAVLLFIAFVFGVWWFDFALMLFSGAFFLFGVAYLLFYPEISGRVAFRKAVARYDAPQVLYRFTQDAIETESPIGGSQVSYSVVHAVVETGDLFLLYVDKRVALILPKAGFEQGTAEDFKTFLWEKTGAPISQAKSMSLRPRIAAAALAAACLVIAYFATNAAFDAVYFRDLPEDPADEAVQIVEENEIQIEN